MTSIIEVSFLPSLQFLKADQVGVCCLVLLSLSWPQTCCVYKDDLVSLNLLFPPSVLGPRASHHGWHQLVFLSRFL